MASENFDLDSPIASRPSRLYPWNIIYPQLSRKPIRLSYSTNTLVSSCARKFQLTKDKNLTEWDIPRDSRENNEHLDFGTAVGIGIATFIQSGSLDKALWAALLNFNYANETIQKNAVSIVTCLETLAATWDPNKWEVANYAGRPAVELSFKIILDSDTQDYYCGYVDAVLQHVETGMSVVLEGKTTGLRGDNIDPLYQNSSQGLGYSTVLDSITQGASSWTVLYLIFQFAQPNIIPSLHIRPYKKSLRDRLEWLINLRYQYEQILSYYAIDYWPKRESGCMFYSKPCQYFGLCDLESMQNLEEAYITKEPEWDFVFHIDELIERSTGK